MSTVVGVILALIVGGSATYFGLDRDRALYPVVMIVVASYYALLLNFVGHHDEGPSAWLAPADDQPYRSGESAA